MSFAQFQDSIIIYYSQRMCLQNSFLFSFCFLENIVAIAKLNLITFVASIVVCFILGAVLLSKMYGDNIKKVSIMIENLLRAMQTNYERNEEEKELRRVKKLKQAWRNQGKEYQNGQFEHQINKQNLDKISRMHKVCIEIHEGLPIKICHLQRQINIQSFQQNNLNSLNIFAKVLKQIGINWEVISFVRLDIKLKIIIKIRKLAQSCQQFYQQQLLSTQIGQQSFIPSPKFQNLINRIKEQLFLTKKQRQNQISSVLNQISQFQQSCLNQKIRANEEQIEESNFQSEVFSSYYQVQMQKNENEVDNMRSNVVNYNKQKFRKQLDSLLRKGWQQKQTQQQNRTDIENQFEKQIMLRKRVIYDSLKKQYSIEDKEEDS